MRHKASYTIFILLSLLAGVLFYHVKFAQTVHRPGANVVQTHYSLRDDDGAESIASFLNTDINAIDQDSAFPVPIGTNFRIRFQLSNAGTAGDQHGVYTIQYAPRGAQANCLSVPAGNFANVPITVTTEPVGMAQTPHYADQSPAFNCTNVLSCNLPDPPSQIFRSATLVEYPSNSSILSSGGSLPAARYTEMEYAVAFTNTATAGETYCFRLTPVNNYTFIAGVQASVPVANVEQVAYRFRNDDGAETTGGARLIGQIHPDADAGVGWNTVVPGPLHFESINDGILQPGIPYTSDYISDDNTHVDTFNMGTIAGGGSYNRVDVWVYTHAVNDDRLNVTLVIGGSPLPNQLIIPTTSFAWYRVSFTGLSLNQADIDGLLVRLIQVKLGTRQDVIVAALYGEVFEPALPATFKAEENTPVFGQEKSQSVRVRFLIKNNGPDQSPSANYRLEFAPRAGPNCAGGDEVFSAVSPGASCGASAACMASSAYFFNQDQTSNISPGINDPVGTFVAGKLVRDPSNEASSVVLAGNPNNQFTELEYAFQFTPSAANNTAYCMRVTQSGSMLAAYTQLAEISTKVVYATTGAYVSSDFDAGLGTRAFNVIEWDWIKTNPACGACDIQFQIKTAPIQVGLNEPSLTWAGPEGKELAAPDETDFFTVSTGQRIHTSHNGDRWIRYKAVFSGTEDYRPILNEVRINFQQ